MENLEQNSKMDQVSLLSIRELLLLPDAATLSKRPQINK
jgi:hypothetical protein